MAAVSPMAVTSFVSLEEYLRTSYEPDPEYIDGELKEKPVVQWTHSNLQAILSSWFHQRRKEWNITVGVESRMKVSSMRVRLPDVVVDYRGYHPQVLLTPPLILIEILSPSDTFTGMQKRIDDYLKMGAPNVWVIDPEARIGFVYRPDAPALQVTRFEVANSPIYIALPELFAEFDEENPR